MPTFRLGRCHYILLGLAWHGMAWPRSPTIIIISPRLAQNQIVTSRHGLAIVVSQPDALMLCL